MFSHDEWNSLLGKPGKPALTSQTNKTVVEEIKKLLDADHHKSYSSKELVEALYTVQDWDRDNGGRVRDRLYKVLFNDLALLHGYYTRGKAEHSRYGIKLRRYVWHAYETLPFGYVECPRCKERFIPQPEGVENG